MQKQKQNENAHTRIVDTCIANLVSEKKWHSHSHPISVSHEQIEEAKHRYYVTQDEGAQNGDETAQKKTQNVKAVYTLQGMID